MMLVLFAAALAAPPAPVLDRLDQALGALEEADRVARFQVVTRVTYSDTDGTDAHVDVVVSEVEPVPGGAPRTRNLSHTRDGEPIPVEQSGKSEGSKLVPPAGDTLPRYVYGPTTRQGALDTAAFSPADLPDQDELARGVLAWDPATLAPVWLTFVPVELDTFVSSLSVRIELGETGGRPHTQRVVAEGVGGIPGFKKRFSFDFVFAEVQWRR